MAVAEREWWETFFDEDYVEAWTAAGAFEGTEGAVAAVERLAGLEAGSRVLDAACGFGRIAGPLSRRGHQVTGIDASDVQLRLAEERNPGPEYLRRDLRDPPSGPFDAVLSLFSSFGYFADRADDAAALRAWHAVLRPGGVLVMDLSHRDQAAHRWEGDDQVVEQGPTRLIGTTNWVTARVRTTVTWGEMTKHFEITVYTITELVGMLHTVGFASVEAFGDLAASGPPTPATRLVLRAVR